MPVQTWVGLERDLGPHEPAATTVPFVWVRVLGSSQVALGDDPTDTVELGARKPRSVLAALSLRLGGELSPDALVDLVWGEDPPPGAHGTLHSYLSGVRRVLEPGLGPRQKPTVLLTSDHGYRLDLPRQRVDAHRFADEVSASRRALAPLASQFTTGPTADWPDRATISDHVDRLEGLLGLWSGEAYADLPDHPDVALERSSLDQLRRGAEEDRVLGLLALGDHAVVVAATEQATARYPLQERVWALHALALARSGRQADVAGGAAADPPGARRRARARSRPGAPRPRAGGPRSVPVLQDWLRPEPGAHPGPAPLDRHRAPAGAPSAGTGRWPPSRRCSTGPPSGEARVRAAGRRARHRQVAARRGDGGGRGRSRLRGRDRSVRPGRRRPAAVAVEPGARRPRPARRARPGRGAGAPAGGRPEDDQGSEERQGFRAWESIAREVLTRSEAAPLLVVLEDLHWADTGSLRVLRRLIASSAPGQQLAVVLTRRPFPEPTGSLADVGEELARHHVTRLDLTGLDLDADPGVGRRARGRHRRGRGGASGRPAPAATRSS